MRGVAAESVQLALFETGPDIARIRQRVVVMKLESSRAKNTLMGYASDWRVFEAWCRDAGRQALPCSSDTLMLYVAAKLQSGDRITTAERHVAAIVSRHRAEGMAVPDRTEVREVIACEKRSRKERPRQRAALTPEQLTKMCNRCCREKTPVAARDRAVLLVGIATALRQSSLVALNLEDVRFIMHKGAVVSVQSSKTDQFGIGKQIGVRLGKHAATCPVRALKDWLGFRGDKAGPLFTRIRAGRGAQAATLERLQPESIYDIVRHNLKAIGIDPSTYGSHSLRAGFVTAAHLQGADTLAIMEVTGHTKLEMVKRYLRNADPFAGPNPLGNAL